MNDIEKIVEQYDINLPVDLSDYAAKTDDRTKEYISLKQHTQDLLSALNLLKSYHEDMPENVYELCRLACFYHDFGKINTSFQKRIQSHTKFCEETEVPHNVLSCYFIPPDICWQKDDYYRLLHAVSYHHNYGNVNEIMNAKETLIEELLNPFPHYKLKKRAKGEMTRQMEDAVAMLVKGYLHRCDYSASAQSVVEYPSDFLQKGLCNMMDRWQSKEKKVAWNTMQQFCQQNTHEDILVIAQTGMGKTEGALWWIGNHKGFFFLPVCTAINAMYDRINKEILCDEKTQERLCILHSSSLDYYLQSQDDFSVLDYEKQSKRYALPLSISTIDQLFDFVYKYPGFELKLATLASSKIVIDEIQMYDPALLACLVCGINRIRGMGGHVAIITATLPPFLVELLQQKQNMAGYDLCVPPPFKTAQFTDEQQRHHMRVLKKEIDGQDIAAQYITCQKEHKSRKILVVCNTIKKAQQIYEDILTIMPQEKENIHLLHGRFVHGDRARKEKEITQIGQTFDENGEMNYQNCIWITTSIVEASLDIDFDYLFTELSDLNSLFQRMGRCNRKGKKSIARPNCFVYTVINQKLFVVKNHHVFLDRVLFDLSESAISQAEGVISEKKKNELIEETMTMEKVKRSDFIQEYYYAMHMLENIPIYAMQKSEINMRDVRTQDVIPGPVYKSHQEEIDSYVSSLTKNNMTFCK